MSILRSKPEIEESLDQQGVAWNYLDDKTYKEIVSIWIDRFEDKLVGGDYISKHGIAIEILESKMPFSGYVFNLPNYKLLPVTPSAHDPSFGYYVERMIKIDRATLNWAEAVLFDENYGFACVFNHEGESMIPEILIEA